VRTGLTYFAGGAALAAAIPLSIAWTGGAHISAGSTSAWSIQLVPAFLIGVCVALVARRVVLGRWLALAE
jgi:Na+/citrate or Na+/malate symporter